MKINLTAALALALFGLTLPAAGEAPALNPHSFGSPDAHFSLEFKGFFDGLYHYDIKDQNTGKVQVLREPDFELWGPLYFVQWTGDSKSILLVYHVADGSDANLLHFDGKSWHQLDVGPTPAESKCPFEKVGGGSDEKHLHYEWVPSYIGTVFSQRTCARSVWLSWGVQTDASHRNSHLYICNFDFDPITQTRSHIYLREVTVPEYRRLKALHDYSQNPYPLAQ